jgi:serine/threonine-protein kinase
MTDLSTDLQAALTGTYTLERELGGGGMSRVFVATEDALHRRVVIKVLPSDIGIELSGERFAREIKLAAALQHPCIVPVLAAGSANGVPFYTMPFVEGMTLRDRLQAMPKLPVDEAVSILRDVSSALAHAHARGIVHRDIKPENILISGGYAQVTDFGIARAITESRRGSQEHSGGTRITQQGFIIGSPAYMAPEQVAGAEGQDQRADIYAVGCLAYEMLAGGAPFSGSDPHLVLRAHLAQTPTDIRTYRSDLSSDLASLVMRCIEKDKALRPQSAEELVELFRAPRMRTPPAPVAAAPRRNSMQVAAQRIPRWAWAMTATTALAAIAVAVFALWPRTPKAESVAVLPFTNLGGDTSQEFFSDGIADDLTSALADIPGLRVASRTSAFAYKGKAVDPREIGRVLDVTELLEGSVRRTKEGLRVNASLIRTRDGKTTWSKTFDRPDTDFFAVQDEITRAIARALRLKWQPVGRAHIPPMEAHEAYLRGEANLDPTSEPALRRAIAFFNQAIAIDSDHAQAHAGLAMAYAYLADVFAPPADAYPQAIAAANKALELDSTSADAHATLGYSVLAYNADPEAAKALFDEAIRDNPNSSRAYEYMSYFELAVRRPKRAVVAAQRALKLDPLSAAASGLVEWWFLMARQPDSAIAQHKVTQRIAPGFLYLDSFLGEALRQKGMHTQALAEYESASRVLGHTTPGHIVTLHAMGRTPEARKALADLEAAWPATYVPPELIAGVHARLGDFDGAIAWLERGVSTKSGLVPLIGVLFDLDPLREEPRYEALLKRVGIPDTVDSR